MTREGIIKSSLKFLVRKQQEQGSWGYSDRNDNEISWDNVLEWLDQQLCDDLISRDVADEQNTWKEKIPHKESYLMWQYTNDPNDIQESIATKDTDWEGLESLHQIISITYDTNHSCYVVFWIASREIMMNDVPNFKSNEYVEKRLENYNKLLKSGILDCVTEEVTGKRE